MRKIRRFSSIIAITAALASASAFAQVTAPSMRASTSFAEGFVVVKPRPNPTPQVFVYPVCNIYFSGCGVKPVSGEDAVRPMQPQEALDVLFGKNVATFTGVAPLLVPNGIETVIYYRINSK